MNGSGNETTGRTGSTIPPETQSNPDAFAPSQEPEQTGSSPNKSAEINCLVAQFNAIKAEILFRATTQAGLMAVNITAIGVIAGFVFSKDADALTLLLIPILSPMLGMLWIDHDINIRSLGRFIGTDLDEAMNACAGSTLPSYQHRAEKEVENTRWRILSFGMPVSFLFGVLPALALIYAVAFSGLANTGAFWGPALLGIICIAMFFRMMVGVLGISSLAWLRQGDVSR